MPLRHADMNSTKRFEDGTDWLVLRTGGLTKGEADYLADLTGAIKVDPAALAGQTPNVAATIEIEKRIAHANRALFELLCVEWSLGEVTGESYSQLDEESGGWVDSCIAETLEERRKKAEKKGPSSRKPAARGSSSAKAAR